jgi:hypothetical protein
MLEAFADRTALKPVGAPAATVTVAEPEVVPPHPLPVTDAIAYVVVVAGDTVRVIDDVVMLLCVKLSGDQVIVQGAVPVRVAVMVADPPGEIVELPLAAAVGATIGTVREPLDCAPQDDVTTTLKTTLPEQFAEYVIVLEAAP